MGCLVLAWLGWRGAGLCRLCRVRRLVLGLRQEVGQRRTQPEHAVAQVGGAQVGLHGVQRQRQRLQRVFAVGCGANRDRRAQLIDAGPAGAVGQGARYRG